MTLFFLKKLVSAFLMPLSIVLIMLILGVILFSKKPRFSRFMLTTGTVLLFLISFPPVSDALIEPLEQRYPPFSQSASPVDYIVVLGCAHSANPELPPSAQLYPCSLQRAVEAYRIHTLHPEAQLITSGSAFGKSKSNAQVVKETLVMLGVPNEKILQENFPKDTEEEAQLIAPLVGSKSVVLVTNANHMPRSVNYFIKKGVNVTPAPTGYKVKQFTHIDRDYDKRNNWDYYFPHVRSAEQTNTVWYEWLGLTVQWLKGSN